MKVYILGFEVREDKKLEAHFQVATGDHVGEHGRLVIPVESIELGGKLLEGGDVQ